MCPTQECKTECMHTLDHHVADGVMSKNYKEKSLCTSLES